MKVKIKKIKPKPKTEIRIKLKPNELKLLLKGFNWEFKEYYDGDVNYIKVGTNDPLQFPVLVKLIQNLDSAIVEYEEE